MRKILLSAFIGCGLSLTGCADQVLPAATGCYIEGYDRDSFTALRDNNFEVKDNAARQALALELVDCLGDPDPVMRDGVAYGALAHWLRNKSLNAETIRSMKQTLLEVIDDGPNAGGFRKPFAAIVTSEIARVDRISPFMSNYDRSAFVDAASKYMNNIKDYRGFDNNQGWRHNVAHGSDWLMQLALNEQITAADFVKIRDAVGSQIKADGKHAYIHGESARLARPILLLARRGAFTEAEWTVWLAEISGPAPMKNWGEAFSSEKGLAQRHNLKQFLSALYLTATLSNNAGTRQLIPGTRAALQKLP